MPKRGRTGNYGPPAKRPYIVQARATRPTMTMSNNPSAFVKLPWYKFTYESDTVPVAGSINNFTINDILFQIRQRLEFKDDAKIRIKVSNSKIWSTAGASSLAVPQIVGSFYNLSTVQVSEYPRNQTRDSGTLNMPAKMMFKWPLADKTSILDDSQGTRTVVAVRTADENALTVRINVWFQTGAIN